MGNILIIDDDTDYAEMLSQQIGVLGYQAAHSPTLHKGLSVLQELGPEAVFLDVMLPDGNGLDVMHAIRAARSQPELIIITGSGDENGAELAIRSGAWDYWQKGRPLNGLMLTLQGALQYRQVHMVRRRERQLQLNGLLGNSRGMTACCDLIGEAAAGDAPVLLRGETGTGKELVARAIHANSARSHKPFVVVDCAALTETLVESILFGHQKGAFTGASMDRVGLVRQAHEGTLFLDEIGELPLVAQKAFLRVLQEKRFRPVGADRETTSDFRLVAATHRDLARMVETGTFREDLYFRLRSFEIILPPLREREDDVRTIAEDVVRRTCQRAQHPVKSMSPELIEALKRYPWPGNVRELVQTMECAVMSSADSSEIELVHLPLPMRAHMARTSIKPEWNLKRPASPYFSYPTASMARDAAMAAYLSKLMEDSNGDIDTACRLADLSRSRLYELLKAHGLTRAALASR
jgi:two-component system NtrC family response regulator